eukprot:Ihof_evm7s23 gene=Ihof_evmTU7s23
MQRNFRSNYLKTLGIRGVQVKVPVEGVLREEVIDLDKLAKLCTTFGVPAIHRLDVWKLLLDISPRHRDGWRFVEEQRAEQYYTVKRFALILLGQHTELSADAPLTTDLLIIMCLTTQRIDLRSSVL